MLVTGGIDCIVRVWNPYVPTHPIATLKGHGTPLSHVIFNSASCQVGVVIMSVQFFITGLMCVFEIQDLKISYFSILLSSAITILMHAGDQHFRERGDKDLGHQGSGLPKHPHRRHTPPALDNRAHHRVYRMARTDSGMYLSLIHI